MTRVLPTAFVPAPHIPGDAPFTPEQRVWLGGFLSGLTAKLKAEEDSGPTRPPVTVLHGSQTGNAEGLAGDLAGALKAQGVPVTLKSLGDVGVDEVPAMGRVLIVCSTYGEGEMPDSAELFWDGFREDAMPRLEGLWFAVLSLGDTGYDDFCQAGKDLDTRFEQLGARRLIDRVDCDVDYDDPAAAWIAEALAVLADLDGAAATAAAAGSVTDAPAKKKPKWSRKNPYPSVLAESRRLSGPGSAKDIHHFEFALDDPDLAYAAGDALGVVPLNDPALVAALLERFAADPEHDVAGRPLRQVLMHDVEIATPSKDLLNELARRAPESDLARGVHSHDRAALDRWIWGRDVLELLEDHPPLGIDEFLPLLRPLQHRSYSISSSPLAAPGRVALTIASVRYERGRRARGGVCSTFLADRLAVGETAGVFVSPNTTFRPPADGDTPMVMVGPGTGIAPFRAFLQERRETGARGRNWLFFGDQHRAHDFLYEDELTEMADQGVLHRLDLAFSRDQADKIYVQTRMREHGAELFSWLAGGAHFYVCGDATHMAKDVDAALHEVVARHGAMDADDAADYVATMRKEKRYVRDVY